MDLLNRVSMIGNLVADPQVREVGEGKLVADFCLAMDPPGAKRSDSDRPVGEAIFVDVELGNLYVSLRVHTESPIESPRGDRLIPVRTGQILADNPKEF